MNFFARLHMVKICTHLFLVPCEYMHTMFVLSIECFDFVKCAWFVWVFFSFETHRHKNIFVICGKTMRLLAIKLVQQTANKQKNKLKSRGNCMSRDSIFFCSFVRCPLQLITLTTIQKRMSWNGFGTRCVRTPIKWNKTRLELKMIRWRVCMVIIYLLFRFIFERNEFFICDNDEWVEFRSVFNVSETAGDF